MAKTGTGERLSRFAKRAIDLGLAAPALVLLSPLLLLLAVWVRLDSPGPAVYRGRRVGLGGREFRIFKFRSMVGDADQVGPPLTAAADMRVTRAGRFLRRTKLDELPQLVNVLRGDMSLVGPRPEAPEYVEHYTEAQRRLLAVRPGITSPASLAFREEESVLTGADAEAAYLRDVLPAKLALDLEYVESASVATDIGILVRTFGVLVSNLPALGALTGAVRRYVPWMVIDAAVVFAGFYAAMLSRFLDGPSQDLRTSLADLNRSILPLIVLFVGMNYLLKLDQRVWRYARGPEVTAIFVSAGLATAVALAADLALGVDHPTRPLPLSVVVVGGVFTICGEVAVRYRSRLVTGFWRWSDRGPGHAEHQIAVIYGAGDTGQTLAWRLLTQREGRVYQVIGFVDDDPAKQGRRIHGVPVLGSGADLTALVEAHRVDVIMLALSKIEGEDLRRIVSLAQETPAQVRIVPGVMDWVSRPAPTPLVREVKVEDLLGRKPAQVDVAACEQVLIGKTVLVTGGCGSVGSELCRQIAVFNPGHLIVLDNNESGLYELALELGSSCPDLQVTYVVGDVTDTVKLDLVFAHDRPQVVFHAAAFKHVPLMEAHPEEAVRVNVFGTAALLDAAKQHGSEHFVLVSTDKAVNPRSVMGATKRLAELIVMASAERQEPGKLRLLCTAVRFGNVLGSRGSVVPTFAKQIEMGGPVTVTHPEMTRYFMDVSEAASLIIQAASLTGGGDVFMLEMGERIRVDELARKMIRLRGLRPEIDIPIVYSGIRPGEKLHEELSHEGEERFSTAHPLIHRFSSRNRPMLDLQVGLERLATFAAEGDRDGLHRELMRLTGTGERGEQLRVVSGIEAEAAGL